MLNILAMAADLPSRAFGRGTPYEDLAEQEKRETDDYYDPQGTRAKRVR
jgi:hypothetical protein